MQKIYDIVFIIGILIEVAIISVLVISFIAFMIILIIKKKWRLLIYILFAVVSVFLFVRIKSLFVSFFVIGVWIGILIKVAINDEDIILAIKKSFNDEIISIISMIGLVIKKFYSVIALILVVLFKMEVSVPINTITDEAKSISIPFGLIGLSIGLFVGFFLERVQP